MTEITTSAGGSLFDALRHEDENGEFWWARELVKPLGYTNWRRFEEAIERGAAALLANGEFPEPHIKTLTAPSKSPGPKSMKDYRLTRYGVYAVIQGADPRKPEIAAGWAYFRVRTREAELAEPKLPELDPDLQRIMELTIGMQQTRNELTAVKREQVRIADELTVTADKVASLEEDVADIKAITPLVGGVGSGALLTIRDVAHAVTGRDMGQNTFARWLVEVGVLFRDHNNELRCKQDWILRELATETWEAWNNGKGWSWVTRFTPRGLARIKQAYVEYTDDVRRETK